MNTYTKELNISAVPTEGEIFYPEEDGQPMAVSDLHRRILIRTLLVLEEHFKQDPDVYISGDILMYYVEGDPGKSISPDVLVTFGVHKKNRPIYKVWEEGKAPDFVMEFSSKNTYRTDLGKKSEIYALLGIQNYFLYDAEDRYLSPPLMGFELIDGSYVPITPGSDEGLHAASLGLDFHAATLGLDFHEDGGIGLDFHEGGVGLGIFDPVAEEWLQTPAESAAMRIEAVERKTAVRIEAVERKVEMAEARVEQEITRAENAEAQAKTAETRAENAEAQVKTAETRAENAEAENARLRKELARLQSGTSEP